MQVTEYKYSATFWPAFNLFKLTDSRPFAYPKFCVHGTILHAITWIHSICLLGSFMSSIPWCRDCLCRGSDGLCLELAASWTWQADPWLYVGSENLQCTAPTSGYSAPQAMQPRCNVDNVNTHFDDADSDIQAHITSSPNVTFTMAYTNSVSTSATKLPTLISLGECMHALLSVFAL